MKIIYFADPALILENIRVMEKHINSSPLYLTTSLNKSLGYFYRAINKTILPAVCRNTNLLREQQIITQNKNKESQNTLIQMLENNNTDRKCSFVTSSNNNIILPCNQNKNIIEKENSTANLPKTENITNNLVINKSINYDEILKTQNNNIRKLNAFFVLMNASKEKNKKVMLQ